MQPITHFFKQPRPDMTTPGAHHSEDYGGQCLRHRRKRRAVVIIVTTCFAILLAGVVVAQASQNYDLACRGVIAGGGGYRVTPSNSFAIVDATGQSIAGISHSSNFGVYGGYIHPFKSATGGGSPPPALANRLNLPFIAKMGRVIRGCQRS